MREITLEIKATTAREVIDSSGMPVCCWRNPSEYICDECCAAYRVDGRRVLCLALPHDQAIGEMEEAE